MRAARAAAVGDDKLAEDDDDELARVDELEEDEELGRVGALGSRWGVKKSLSMIGWVFAFISWLSLTS